jgi:hypothetical protein
VSVAHGNDRQTGQRQPAATVTALTRSGTFDEDPTCSAPQGGGARWRAQRTGIDDASRKALARVLERLDWPVTQSTLAPPFDVHRRDGEWVARNASLDVRCHDVATVAAYSAAPPAIVRADVLADQDDRDGVTPSTLGRLGRIDVCIRTRKGRVGRVRGSASPGVA